MKQALEALELLISTDPQEEAFDYADNAITDLRQAIERAEKQEPVVWMYQDKSTHEVRFQKHMRGFVGGFLKLPSVKKALMSDMLRSRFLSALRTATGLQGKAWLTEM